jgi:hypothetical protein
MITDENARKQQNLSQAEYNGSWKCPDSSLTLLRFRAVQALCGTCNLTNRTLLFHLSRVRVGVHVRAHDSSKKVSARFIDMTETGGKS